MRSFLATLLALAACALLPVALVAVWLGTVVDDTDRYVDTVGPLATDPAVVSAAEETLTDRTLDVIRARTSLDPTQIRGGVAAGVRTVLTSTQFPPAWEAANAEAHRQLLAQLRGTGADPGDDVAIDLGPVVDSVIDEIGAGMPLQITAPRASVPVTVLRGEQVQQARAAYDVLDAARAVGPLTWVGLVLLALLVSPRRPRTLVLLGVGSAATLALLLVALGLVRDRVVASVSGPDQALSGAVWDGVTRSLDLTVYGALALCVVVTVLGALTGIATRRRA